MRYSLQHDTNSVKAAIQRLALAGHDQPISVRATEFANLSPNPKTRHLVRRALLYAVNGD